TGDLSWSMIKFPDRRRQAYERYGAIAVQAGVTPAHYWEQAVEFSADHYDPDQWCRAIKAAGARYVVLTTKHHDGFALWPSAFGDFNIGIYQPGRDLVGEFVNACRAHGLKIGFYYSPPDWYFNRHRMSFSRGNDGVDLGIHHEPITLPDQNSKEEKAFDAKYRAYIKGQVEELLTRYGTIDLLWFDGNGSDAITLERIHELQPGIVVNRRAGAFGDFATPECSFPKERPQDWWEFCHIWNDGAWGYLSHEIYKPLGWMLTEFVKARSWNGNFLINMGPNSHGELPHAALQRLQELAAWMQHSAESVFGTSAGPWPQQCNLPVTCRQDTWYVHVTMNWDGPVELRGVAAPRTITLLRTGESLPYTFADGTLTITLADDLRSVLDDVIAVRWA
ncbi:MAG TPA: alpha-L-fucosidase, partial [Armatimonadota bacterium]|nr:alpha-L-fucosidase [Armatimonadota bacterium]